MAHSLLLDKTGLRTRASVAADVPVEHDASMTVTKQRYEKTVEDGAKIASETQTRTTWLSHLMSLTPSKNCD
jgi:hypothetical protein